MKSNLLALLLSGPGVTKTHSGTQTSVDNPFSEWQFKTLKYRPDLPSRYGSNEEARAFSQGFFSRYNRAHRHTGIALLTPEAVHYSKTLEILRQGEKVLIPGYNAHPERVAANAPASKTLPDAVWTNPPKPASSGKRLL